MYFITFKIICSSLAVKELVDGDADVAPAERFNALLLAEAVDDEARGAAAAVALAPEDESLDVV